MDMYFGDTQRAMVDFVMRYENYIRIIEALSVLSCMFQGIYLNLSHRIEGQWEKRRTVEVVHCEGYKQINTFLILM